MWDGQAGEIFATKPRIDLKSGSVTKNQIYYRHGLSMRKTKSKKIHQQIYNEEIELSTKKWASPVVLVPKKDGYVRFCVDYGRLNAAKVPDTYQIKQRDH